MLITTEGVIIRLSVNDISIIGRNTSGVKMMNIDQDSNVRVASIAKVRESSSDVSDEEEEETDDNKEEETEE